MWTRSSVNREKPLSSTLSHDYPYQRKEAIANLIEGCFAKGCKSTNARKVYATQFTTTI